jgi:hypothetical protein
LEVWDWWEVEVDDKFVTILSCWWTWKCVKIRKSWGTIVQNDFHYLWKVEILTKTLIVSILFQSYNFFDQFKLSSWISYFTSTSKCINILQTTKATVSLIISHLSTLSNSSQLKTKLLANRTLHKSRTKIHPSHLPSPTLPKLPTLELKVKSKAKPLKLMK